MEWLEFLKVTLAVRPSWDEMADWVMVLHLLISMLTVFWSLLVDQRWLAAATALLWLLAYVLWLEYKRAEG